MLTGVFFLVFGEALDGANVVPVSEKIRELIFNYTAAAIQP